MWFFTAAKRCSFGTNLETLWCRRGCGQRNSHVVTSDGAVSESQTLSLKSLKMDDYNCMRFSTRSVRSFGSYFASSLMAITRPRVPNGYDMMSP
jgi:hypothetical protein